MQTEIHSGDLNVASEFKKLEKTPVDLIQLVRYAGASGDFNPLHLDPEVGKAAGTGQIAQGMLIMGFVGQAITDWIPKKYLKKLSVRFIGMTKIGDVVTVTGKVKEKSLIVENGLHKVICDVQAQNQRGELLVSGYFEADLP